MKRVTWEALGKYAIALILFICTFRVIEWVIALAATSPLDSGWAQAIGAVIAIAAAFFVGRGQSAAAIESVREADRIATRKHKDAVLGLAQIAHHKVEGVAQIFEGGEFNVIVFRTNYDANVMSDIKDALNQIPVDTLGSYEAVDAMLKLRTAMGYFLNAVEAANSLIRTTALNNDGKVPPVLEFRDSVIELNRSVIFRQRQRLETALGDR